MLAKSCSSILLDSLSSSHSSVGSNIPGVPGTDSVDVEWEELEDSAGDIGLVGAGRNRENLEWGGERRGGEGRGGEGRGGERGREGKGEEGRGGEGRGKREGYMCIHIHLLIWNCHFSKTPQNVKQYTYM